MSHDDILPKRIAGANMPGPCPLPEGGWFGTGVAWPTEDLDERTRQAMGVLLDCSLPAESELGQLLQQLLDGLDNLVPPKPVDNVACIGTPAAPDIVNCAIALYPPEDCVREDDGSDLASCAAGATSWPFMSMSIPSSR